MDHSEAFLEQWSQSDTDAKASLLTSLISTLQDPEQSASLDKYVSILSESLHSPHHSLVSASLKALPAFFQAISRSNASSFNDRVLKQIIKSSLSQHGNLVEKMGDPKIAVREAARVTLLDASVCALTFSNTNVADSAAALIDKAVREQGFGSKNVRVREASLRYLASLRTSPSTGLRTDQLPPLRPYLPLLIHILEDPDPTVREAAKESTVVIFSDTRISDAARAELKKEISKGSVRKTTAEHVLAGVFAGGPTSQEPPHSLEGSEAAAPPPSGSSSMGTALTSSDITPVYIASTRDLENEFNSMVEPFEGKETEHNWHPRDRSISRIRGLLKGEVVSKYGDSFVRQIKQVSEGIIRCMLSLRTTLAVSAVYLVAELSRELKSSGDSLFEPFFSTLVKLSAGTKKLLVAASEAAMSSLLTYSTCIAKMCHMLAGGMAEKSAVARTAISAQLPVLLRAHARQDKATFDASGSTPIVEQSIRKALTDATPSVREKARDAYWVFYDVWPAEAERIASTLDTQGRIQLDKAKARAGGTSNASKPQLMKSTSSTSARPSMKEMIAARKAAAKKAAQDTASSSENAVEQGNIDFRSPPAKGSDPSISRLAASPQTPGTPTRKPASRPSASANDSSSVRRSVYDPRRSSLMRQSSSTSSTESHSRRLSPTSSPEHTPQKLPPSRRSIADKSVNLMAFATPAADSSSSTGTRRRSSQSADDSVLADRMAQHNLLDTSMDADSGMALEAMRNQANQAEQTAERLLELAADEEEENNGEEDDDGPPTAKLPQTFASPRAPAASTSSALNNTPAVPATPFAKKGVSKEFQDSPAVEKPSGSMLLSSRATQDSWWLEKAKYSRPASPLSAEHQDEQLSSLVDSLTSSSTSAHQLRKLSRVSQDRPLPLADEDSDNTSFWSANKCGSRLVAGLLHLLDNSLPSDVKDAGLLLLKDVVCNQSGLVVHCETQLVSLLLRLRQDPSIQVSAAGGAIMDLYLRRQDALSALSTLRSCLNSFVPAPGSGPSSSSKSFSFGLKGLATLFQGLPAEVLEDQIPLTSGIILSALNSCVADVRQSGILTLVAAQSVLRDEQRVFDMFKEAGGHGTGGLTEQQMALATYYFAKAEQG